MLAFGLRVLYAGEVLDGSLLPLLPRGRPAAEPGAGGRPVRPGAGPGNQALPRLRETLCAGRPSGVLLDPMCRDCSPKTSAGLYEKTEAGQLAFDLKKSIYIKAFQVRFEGAGYVSISDPHFCGPKANKNGPIRSRVKSTGANERLTNGALIVKPV